MKKTIIIMGSLILAAIIALTLVLVLKPQNKRPSMLRDMQTDMTFEQFTKSMKSDLPSETMDEVKELFEKFKDADMEGKAEILNKLREMDVYEQRVGNAQSGVQAIPKEEFEKLVKQRQQKNND